MTAKLPKKVTPALMRKLNDVHMARMGTCDDEFAGVGYCAAVWRMASQKVRRTEERKEVR